MRLPPNIPLIKPKPVDPSLQAMVEAVLEQVKTGKVSALLVGLVMRDGNVTSTAYGDTGQLVVALFDAQIMLAEDRKKGLLQQPIPGFEIPQ